jgi:pimeloyl-ACP methyl ester carboxylesterase
MRTSVVCVGLVLLACPGRDFTPRDGGFVLPDAGRLTDGGQRVELRRCPTTGQGAMEGDVCFVVSPAETGLEASGTNANVDQYALRPQTNARGALLVFFNGSGGSPRAGTGTAAGSFYGVARAQGLHVLAVSYSSDSAVGQLCANQDACFEPTRASILLGEPQLGAAAAVNDLTPDEGAFERIARTVLYLAEGDASGGWEAFIDRTKLPDAEAAIRWESILVAGHSQGGGHAALVAKRQRVGRVVMLASPCDGDGMSVSGWLSSSMGWKTEPSRMRGLWSMGDTTCRRAPEAWTRLGLSPANRTDDAPVCAGETPHSAPLRCASNAARWAELLAP